MHSSSPAAHQGKHTSSVSEGVSGRADWNHLHL